MNIRTKSTITMRWDSPIDVNTRLRVLAAQLQIPVRQLLDDAVALVLRYHSIPGIPAPPVRTMPAVSVESAVVVADEIVVEEEPSP